MTKNWLAMRDAFWGALLKDCPGNISMGQGGAVFTSLVITEQVPFQVFTWVLWYYSRTLMHITQSSGDSSCFIVGHMGVTSIPKVTLTFGYYCTPLQLIKGLNLFLSGVPLYHMHQHNSKKEMYIMKMKRLLKVLFVRRRFTPGDIIFRSSIPEARATREVAMVLPSRRGVLWLSSPFHASGETSSSISFEDFQIFPDAWENLWPSLEERLLFVKLCFVTDAPPPSIWERFLLLFGVPASQRCLSPGPSLTWEQWGWWATINGHFAAM